MPRRPPKRFVLLSAIIAYVSLNILAWFKSNARGIRFNFIFGDSLAENDVGKAIYDDFLSKALAEGTFVAAPEPGVVGTGD
jgi:hypothetical protein